MKARRPKVLFWDAETLPLECTAWDIYKPFLTHENIRHDFTIASVAWRWLGGRSGVDSVLASTPRDDKALVWAAADLLASADVVVHHNGDKFDVPALNVRLLYHGLRPLPPLVTVDTKKLAFRRFRFSCAKLDYLARFLGIGRKVATGGYQLWLDVLAGDPAALAKMRRYNVGDVKLLEAVYLKLRAFDERHPNLALVAGKRCCPTCTVGVLENRGLRFAKTRTYRRLVCRNCGAWSRETTSVDAVDVVTA